MPITNQPSPQRQTVLTFVSPNVQDLLFYETVDAQRVGRTPPEYGTPHPDTVKFPNHILSYVTQADQTGQLYYYYYTNTRASQDDYNFEYSQASLGDTRFDTVVRTYVTLRSEFKEDDTNNTAGSAMPTAPAAANFEGKGYVLMTRNQRRIGQAELDSVFVIEQKTYFVPDSFSTQQFDDLSHKNLKTTTSFFYSGQEPVSGKTIDSLLENPADTYWAVTVNDEGTRAFIREGRQLSSDWFEVVYKELVAGAAVGGVISLDSYYTTIDHSWPPVFKSSEVHNWEKHDGTSQKYYPFEFSPDGYSGPCKALVEISWSASPQNISGAKAMVPKAINLSTPYFKIATPPCLHGDIDLAVFVGNNDPVYKSAGLNYQRSGTEYTDWPSSIVVRDKQDVARGGYVRTKWTVYPPSKD